MIFAHFLKPWSRMHIGGASFEPRLLLWTLDVNPPDLFLIELIGIYHLFDNGESIATSTLLGGCLRSPAVVLPSPADRELGDGWVEPSGREKFERPLLGAKAVIGGDLQ